MKNQQGSSLVVAMIFLIIITLVTTYALEGSNLQSKMVTNSLFSTLTYQECRNEQEANVRHYNLGDNRSALIDLTKPDATPSVTINELKTSGADFKESTIQIDWRYIGEAAGGQGIVFNSGNSTDTNSPITAYGFELDCESIFRFSTNSQTLGAKVQALKIDGKVI